MREVLPEPPPEHRYQLTDSERAFCDQVIAAGCHPVKYDTFALVEDLLAEGVSGDFAECGVWAGAQPAVMLYVLHKHGIRDRRVHLFDSFQGIPRATAEDQADVQAAYGLTTGTMESSGVSSSSVENTLHYLRLWRVYDPALVVIHPGWFEETLVADQAKIDRLALLRVDVDLYQSTKTVYEHLYSKVVPGGYVIDDDYGLPDTMPACRRALEEVIGPQSVRHVEGQPTTAWWRKA